MQDKSNDYLKKVNNSKRTNNVLAKVVVCLSFVVILSVFWGLKLTGITLAGDAHCGQSEHIHSEECQQKELICNIEEVLETETVTQTFADGSEVATTPVHTHTDECYKIINCEKSEHIHTESCYSDVSADLETDEDWEATFANVERSDSVAENVVAVAKTQLGYKESIRNFEIDANGEKRGITRYGQWYGNDYGEWSAMF